MNDNETNSDSGAPTTIAAPPTQSTAPMGGTTLNPGAGMVPQEEKGQATLVWVLTIFFGFVPALIFFLISKDKPFVYRHAAYALATQIVTTIGWIAAGVLMMVLIGFLLLPVVGLFHLYVCIKGAIAANNGDEYVPPLAGNFAKMLGI